MATIDYKQKIKDYMNSSEVDTLYKSMLNNLFPELRESEDERISKEIIKYLEQTVPHHHRDEVLKSKEWTAWLEKQGEQKPDEEYNITGISSNKSQGKLGEIIKNLKTTWSEKDEVGLANAMLAIEQARTIAKDENDMGNLWYAERWLKSLKDRVGCEVNCTTTKEWSKEDESILTAIIEEGYLKPSERQWLKSLKDRVQPKQEWGEEDESYLKSALWHISYAMSNGRETSIRCDLTEWLKSLKDRISQPKQKWSEKDKKMLESIKKTLYNLTLVEADGQSAFKKELAWLKSIRPHSQWKPSGEQMEFVWKYAEQNNYDGKVFTRLYNDLKKLKD